MANWIYEILYYFCIAYITKSIQLVIKKELIRIIKVYYKTQFEILTLVPKTRKTVKQSFNIYKNYFNKKKMLI